MTEIKTLIRAGLPPSVRAETGPGGLTRLRVRSAAAEADVYLQGAQVTAWRPGTSLSPVLWLSRQSRFEPGQPIRGGIPVCFPWFSKHPADPAAPPHGFARTADWALIGAREEAAGAVTLDLELAGERLSPLWPHRFRARLRAGIGLVVRLDLEVLNTGKVAFTFEEALHAYFDVGDIRSAALLGLEGAPFLDKTGGRGLSPAESSPVRFTGLTNRVYPDTRAACTIRDPARRRDIVITGTNSNSTVVWNPWADRAREMEDFGDDEWTGMLCVEPANIGAAAPTLAPGQSHTMGMIIAAG